MYRFWQIANPHGVLTAIGAFLFVLALLIHFLLLGSQGFNWLADAVSDGPAEQAAAPQSAATKPN